MDLSHGGLTLAIEADCPRSARACCTKLIPTARSPSRRCTKCRLMGPYRAALSTLSEAARDRDAGEAAEGGQGVAIGHAADVVGDAQDALVGRAAGQIDAAADEQRARLVDH